MSLTAFLRCRPRIIRTRSSVLSTLFSLLIVVLLLPTTAFANPVPFVNQPLVPTAVAPGGAQFTLTVNGTGFVNGAAVNWNGAALTTTYVSGSELTATVPAANIASPRTAGITVINPPPGGGTSNDPWDTFRQPNVQG